MDEELSSGGYPQRQVCPPPDVDAPGTERYNDLSFPHGIPTGTAIPDWVFIPIDGFLDEFDAVGSERIGDKFESIGSVAPIATESSQGTSAGSVTSVSGGPTATQHANTGAGLSPTSTGNGAPGTMTGGPEPPAETSGTSSQTHSANIGGIVGGVVGGLAGLAMVVGLLVYFRRGRHPDGTEKAQLAHHSPENAAFIPPSAPPSPYYASAGTDQDTMAATKEESPAGYVESVSFMAPEPVAVVVPEMSQAMRLYDPEDPATFPPTPAPFMASISPRTNMAVLDTYPNVVPDQTHEDDDRVGTVYGRRPVPEL